MKAFFVGNKALLAALAAVFCAIGLVLTTLSVQSAGHPAVQRTFEQEKTIALQAIQERQNLAVQGQICVQKAQSVEQVSDCLDAEYEGKAVVEERLHPIKSRPETLADLAQVL